MASSSNSSTLVPVTTNVESPFFEMKSSPDKQGLGLFAKQGLQPGKRVLSEKPLLLIESGKRDTYYTRVFTAFEALSDVDREKFLNLSDYSSCPEETLDRERQRIPNFTREQARKILSIVITNAWEVEGSEPIQGDSKIAEGVFDFGSRFNHSCRPNVTASWSRDHQRFNFQASRFIAVGEELLVSYMFQHHLSKEERKRQLKNSWGFDCACDVCVDSDFAAKNAEFRAELRRSQPEPYTLSKRDNRAKFLHYFRSMLIGLQEEGTVEGYNVPLCISAARILQSEDDVESVLMLMLYAEEFDRIAYGTDSHSWRRWRESVRMLAKARTQKASIKDLVIPMLQ